MEQFNSFCTARWPDGDGWGVGVGADNRRPVRAGCFVRRRRQQTVFHPVEPQFAGMIMKVKELVRVEEVEKRLTREELKAERKPDPGFWIEKAVPR